MIRIPIAVFLLIIAHMIFMTNFALISGMPVSAHGSEHWTAIVLCIAAAIWLVVKPVKGLMGR